MGVTCLRQFNIPEHNDVKSDQKDIEMTNKRFSGENVDDSDRAPSSKGYWRKSSFSGSNGDCVEVAFLASDHVGVRDSKATAGPYLRFPPSAWTAFVGDIRKSTPQAAT